MLEIHIIKQKLPGTDKFSEEKNIIRSALLEHSYSKTFISQQFWKLEENIVNINEQQQESEQQSIRSKWNTNRNNYKFNCLDTKVFKNAQ